jgi:hypothetical protein
MAGPKRRPILMGKAELVATGTEEPCRTLLTQSALAANPRRPSAPNEYISITPKCHPDAGMKIWYCRADGCALLVCSECGAGVARMLLAVEEPS